VVPCHRVIHADGSIGGWGEDLWVKRWLLRHERAAN
jgi:O6-methylguanine-DNA--protein-cysteine methyltransferase